MPRAIFVVTQRPGALLETFPFFIEIMTRVVNSTEGGGSAGSLWRACSSKTQD